MSAKSPKCESAEIKLPRYDWRACGAIGVVAGGVGGLEQEER